MKAIIMAGGEGTRLRPLTCDRPKPMVTLFDRPVMEYIIVLLRKMGIVEIGVTLQYLPQLIIDYFEDGAKFGVKLHYFIENEPLGTAGSVKGAEHFLDDDFIVISGDAVSNLDLSQAITFHKHHGALATLVLYRVSQPLSYGVVVTDKSGKIERFVEKPTWPHVVSDRVNTGIYICKKEILTHIPPNTFYDFSKNLFAQFLESKTPLYGCELPGYWCDIGDIDAYLTCHTDILSGKAKGLSPVPLEENSAITQKNAIYIAQGAIIEPGAKIGPYTSIQQGATVKSGAKVARSVLYPGVIVEKNCEVKGALLCQGARLQERSSCFEGCVVGSKSVLEADVTLTAGAKVWPQKQIEEESIISQDIIWGNSAQSSLPYGGMLSGVFNSEITGGSALRLASATGLLCKGGQFAAACSHGPSGTALKGILLSGASLSGTASTDCGIISKEAFSYYLWKTGTDFGIYANLFDNMATLTVLNVQGLPLNESQEKQLCALFQKGDMLYSPTSLIQPQKRCQNIAKMHNAYVLGIFQPPKKRTRICLSDDKCILSKELRAFLTAFGADIVKPSRKMRAGISTFTIENRVLRLTDEKGNKIAPEHLFLFLCRLYHAIFPDNPLYVSSWMAFVIPKDHILKNAPTTTLLDQANHSQRSLADAVFCAGLLMSFLANGGSLHSALSGMETPFVSRSEVYCAAGRKGKVMQRLLSEHGAKAPGFGGVEIENGEGEIFITLHPKRPVCHICVAGFKEEISAELCGEYENKIAQFQEDMAQ